MKSVMLASLAVAATAQSPHVPNKVMLFANFMTKFDKQYANEDEKTKRFGIFMDNVDIIYASNANKTKTYKLGITANADLTFDEWKAANINGFKPPALTSTEGQPTFSAPKAFTPPDSVDWTTKGAVTTVKNQGTCGSCWTFSAIGALEGAMFIAGRPLTDLSTQNVLACDTGGNGCKGGSMSQAFGWVEKNGLMSWKEDPYLCLDGTSAECTGMTCDAGCTKKTGETCIFSGCTKFQAVCNKDNFLNQCECPDDQCFADGKCAAAGPKPELTLKVGDVTTSTNVDQTENALEAAVAQQPVSVAIEADQSVFQHYTSGVLTNDACGSALDHGVLAVGYGVDSSSGKAQKYWKVKNSWGPTWGDHGYIKIEKGSASDGGECGIRKMASFPTVKKASNEIIV